MTPEARVLAEAFIDDPLMAYFWPEPKRRQRALPLFWHSRVEARRRAGIVDTASDGEGVTTVLLWERPGCSVPMAEPVSLIRALGAAAPRALAASRRIESLRPATPHLYLAVGAALPRARGKGVTSRLVRARIDAADIDVFVVATNPVSAAMAEHAGFHTTQELVLENGATLRGMLRPA
ncbi:N-acetyltransferase [Nocardia inohanensis]|uniref:N-acetyltransferase n=1 Tax=Nocardia inohanensis TaxID=209246 RepID=UPI00082FAACB|nr:N-acetyltransferase [Nocardia inohanensis]